MTVVTYLDELAIRNLMQRTWDEFAWPVSPMPEEDEVLACVGGHMVEIGPHFPSVHFTLNRETGKYLGYARRLIFEGNILTYDPTMNEATRVPVRSSVKTLNPVEQVSMTDLSNLNQ